MADKTMAKFDSTEITKDLETNKSVWSLLDKINQVYEQITASIPAAIPTGSIEMFGASTAPTGWLICDGSAVSRTIYSTLFGIIGTTWGTGDGVTTFNLPDFREASPYGVGTRSSGVTAHDVATLSQFKDDQMQGHLHAQPSGTTNYIIQSGGANSLTIGGGGYGGTVSRNSTGTPKDDGTNGTPRTGTVTRGKIIGVYFIIKT